MMGFLQNLFKPSGPEGLPVFFNTYLDSVQKIDNRTPIKSLKFVVFDTETTSLEKDARLLSIGAIKCTTNQLVISDILDCYVSWEENSEKPKNVEIHGITNRQSESGVSPEEAIEQFVKFIDGAVLVAQHVDFDVAVVNGILMKYFKKAQLRSPFLDTAQLAIRLEQSRFDRSTVDRKQYTLDALMERYKIQPLERHSAIGDAYCTAILLMKLLSKLEGRGLKTLRDLKTI
ncbi:MAG: PolC-type DNA polymerase III [Fulvivirga sp.]